MGVFDVDLRDVTHFRGRKWFKLRTDPDRPFYTCLVKLCKEGVEVSLLPLMLLVVLLIPVFSK